MPSSSAGEAVTTGPVATLYVTKSLKAEAFVPVALSRHLRDQKPYRFIANGRPLGQDVVKLDYFSPTVNLSSNTISVYFSLRDKAVLPGLKCILHLQ